MKQTLLHFFVVTFITILIFFVAGEIALRNFTYYDIEFYVSMDMVNTKIEENKYGNVFYIRQNPVFSFYEVSQDKKNKTRQKQLYKIMVLGDSLATGAELKEGELGFPEALIKKLKKDYPEIDFTVSVFAEGGYSTSEEVNGYEKFGKSLNPDLVILSFCHNDAVEIYKKIIKKKGEYFLAFRKANIPYLSKVPFNGFLTERFLIVRVINEFLIKSLFNLHLFPKVEWCLRADIKIYEAFKKLSLLTKSSNTSVLVIVFPYLEQIQNMSRARMAQLIKKWCEEFNFLNIDLFEIYKNFNYQELQAHPTDIVHPNALGRRIAAEAILEKLKQNVFCTNEMFRDNK